MKKRNIKTLVTGLVLAAAMAVTPMMAMAETEGSSEASGTTEESTGLPGSAIVTKVVTTAAEGVTVPDRSFTFTATLINGHNSNYSGTLPKAPSSAPEQQTVTIDKTNAKKGEKTEGTINFGTLDNGVYIYKLTENNLDENGAADDLTEGYGWTKDKTEYQITIYKKTGQAEYAIQKIKDDGKLDSTKVNTADFTNTYTARGNKDGSESLKITKAVVHPEYAKDQSWKFDLTFTLDNVNAGILNGDAIKAKIGTEEKTFNSDNQYHQTIELAADQPIVFDNIPAGTKYTLTEHAYEGDTPSATLIENGKDANVSGGSPNTTYTIKENALIGENANSVTVTNTYQQVTPTGVVLNNMPFIVMMAAAAAAIFGYVALKRKISK